MRVSVPEQLAGGVRNKIEAAWAKGAVYDQFIAVTEIVDAFFPTKLESTSILQQQAEPNCVLGRCLRDDSMFARGDAILGSRDEDVSNTYGQIVLVLFILVRGPYDPSQLLVAKNYSQFPK